MRVRFTANDRGKPPDYQEIERTHRVKVADAAIEFEDGPLSGLSLTGFVVWCSLTDRDVLYVSPPERTINTGVARGASYALLRPSAASDHDYRPSLTKESKAFICEAFRRWRDGA